MTWICNDNANCNAEAQGQAQGQAAPYFLARLDLSRASYSGHPDVGSVRHFNSLYDVPVYTLVKMSEMSYYKIFSYLGATRLCCRFGLNIQCI